MFDFHYLKLTCSPSFLLRFPAKEAERKDICTEFMCCYVQIAKIMAGTYVVSPSTGPSDAGPSDDRACPTTPVCYFRKMEKGSSLGRTHGVDILDVD